MARRKKKRKPVASASSASTEPTGNPSEEARSYWLERAAKRARGGQTERALQALLRSGLTGEERLGWLLARWPERGVEELGATHLTPEMLRDVLGVLGETVLSWPHAEALLALDALPADWRSGARLIRAASERVAAGDDTEARALLRRIPRDSPFVDAQRFLRGLSAWYQRDEVAAALSWDRLAETTYGLAIERLRAAVEPERAAAEQVLTALDARRPNQALRALASAWQALSPPLRRLFIRELPRRLHDLGVGEEAVPERMARALPSLGAELTPRRLLALTLEVGGWSADAAESWSRAAERGGEDAAALLHHAGVLWADVSGATEQREPCPDCGAWHDDYDEDYAASALDALERAVELEPGEPTWWLDLLRVSAQAGDRRENDRLTERFVQRFPEHPQALRRAAEAAEAREAFDKALRYARRAIALEPLDRGLNDLRVRLLVGKARKKYAAGQHAQAGALLTEASEVAHCGLDMAQRASAARAAFVSLRDLEAAEALRRESDETDSRPWMWALRFIGARALFDPAGRSSQAWPEAWLATQPVPEHEELRALMQLGRELTGAYPSFEPKIAAVVVAAIEAGRGTLQGARHISQALSWALSDEATLELATRGVECSPLEADFVATRARLLLARDATPAELEVVEGQLARVITHIEETFTGYMRQAMAGDLLGELRRLRKRVRARVRRSSGPAENNQLELQF